MFLWDGTRHRQWDVCSVWHSPGPDMITSTSVADVEIEINDVIDPFKFTLIMKPVNETPESQLEVNFLSETEGKYFLLL